MSRKCTHSFVFFKKYTHSRTYSSLSSDASCPRKFTRSFIFKKWATQFIIALQQHTVHTDLTNPSFCASPVGPRNCIHLHTEGTHLFIYSPLCPSLSPCLHTHTHTHTHKHTHTTDLKPLLHDPNVAGSKKCTHSFICPSISLFPSLHLQCWLISALNTHTHTHTHTHNWPEASPTWSECPVGPKKCTHSFISSTVRATKLMLMSGVMSMNVKLLAVSFRGPTLHTLEMSMTPCAIWDKGMEGRGVREKGAK